MMKTDVFRMMVVASLMVSVSFLSSGCSKPTVPSEEMQPAEEITMPEPMEEEPSVDVGEGMGDVEPIDATPIQQTEQYTISEGRTHGPMLPIYFDFDKSNIRDDQVSRIEGNADFLKANPAVDITIEGNCDERGTNEYNMALGERRAQRAKKYLMNLGIDDSRMNTVSYGEEKPLLYGHDEFSWAQNRRDDFVIR